MKTVISGLIISLAAGSFTVLPASALSSPSAQLATVQPAAFSDAELDSLLAPVALYPDSLLTHILIASTYPLDVVSANRWRQANPHLTPQQVELALDDVNWDPSVRAIAPFTDLLATMADDLDWLGSLGDAVVADQRRVLDHVQMLRQQAYQHGELRSNNYVTVERERDVIVIAPATPQIVYVPYYNVNTVYGHWHHPIHPVYWRAPVRSRVYAGFHWGFGVNLSAGFYFGDIFWHERAVFVRPRPVRYYHYREARRVASTSYQRWNHRQTRPRVVSHRHRNLAAPRAANPSRSVVSRHNREPAVRSVPASVARHQRTEYRRVKDVKHGRQVTQARPVKPVQHLQPVRDNVARAPVKQHKAPAHSARVKAHSKPANKPSKHGSDARMAKH
ncbi:DUF3300 domain-containing protein [Alteromonas sp. CYL-A6]|uniref:DUF3300 domain-containing protein n=1 Tax=Alteromonas nitratireducens TaxID=3390813 RepID=UPI0034AE202E